jgi:hypothetical protein
MESDAPPKKPDESVADERPVRAAPGDNQPWGNLLEETESGPAGVAPVPHRSRLALWTLVVFIVSLCLLAIFLARDRFGNPPMAGLQQWWGEVVSVGGEISRRTSELAGERNPAALPEPATERNV